MKTDEKKDIFNSSISSCSIRFSWRCLSIFAWSTRARKVVSSSSRPRMEFSAMEEKINVEWKTSTNGNYSLPTYLRILSFSHHVALWVCRRVIEYQILQLVLLENIEQKWSSLESKSILPTGSAAVRTRSQSACRRCRSSSICSSVKKCFTLADDDGSLITARIVSEWT